MEKYVDIKGYEGLYQVSNYGNVKSLERRTKVVYGETTYYRRHKSCILKPVKSTNGYLKVTLADEYNVKREHSIHRLVALHFLEYRQDLVVNHIDGNKENNHIENLELVTIYENNDHALYNELNIGSSKLNHNDVKEIRRLYATGNYTYQQLAEKYNMTYGSIYNIVKYKTWKFI